MMGAANVNDASILTNYLNNNNKKSYDRTIEKERKFETRLVRTYCA